MKVYEILKSQFIMDFLMEVIEMNSKCFPVFFLIITSTTYAQRLPLPFLNGVTLRCDTTSQQSNGMLYYSYEISNGTSSTGDIGGFNIDISKDSNEISYDTVGLKYQDDGFTEGAFRRHYPAVSGKVVPVGFPSTPVRWIASLSNDLNAAFFGDSLIAPGNSISGFLVMSRGLPGIRRFFASPFFDPTKYFADPDVYPDSAADMDSVDHALNYYGWTIGPTAPPLDFSASSWIDTLVSYKHQCVTLGWLPSGKEDKDHRRDCDEMMRGRDWYKKGGFEKFRGWEPEENWDFDKDWNNGIVEVLDRRLNKAKDKLFRKDSVGARRDLEIFVMEVEMLNEVSAKLVGRRETPIVTSEGYALLKYNAEYLIDKLPGRHGRGEDQKGKIER
jgi:hypothetical protein